MDGSKFLAQDWSDLGAVFDLFQQIAHAGDRAERS